MKTLTRSGIILGAFALAVMIALPAITGAAGKSDARVKLGGTWVGRNGDITWIGSYNPDASGQNATFTLQWMTMGEDFQQLLASLGAESISLASGSMTMTSNDTADGKMIWYNLGSGPVVPSQVKIIAVMTSHWHYDSPTTAEGTHNLKMYLPNANGSLLPEDGTQILNLTFENVPHIKIQ